MLTFAKVEWWIIVVELNYCGLKSFAKIVVLY